MDVCVVVPSWNCMTWLPGCLASIASQQNEGFGLRVVVIDDASPDPGQGEFVERVCGTHGWECILNDRNLRCPYNIWAGIERLAPAPDDVVVVVDGDDRLAHERALAIIHGVFDDPDIWLTYGNYAPWPTDTGQPPAVPYPEDVIAARSFRHHNICFNHPLAFRGFLWAALEPADLQDDEGEWFRAGYDEAIMWPLLEMAGEHHAALSEVLYLYNTINPLSDGRVRDVDEWPGDVLRSRPPKPKLVRS